MARHAIDVDENKIIDMYCNEHKSLQEIANEMHCGVNTVSRRLQAHNIPTRAVVPVEEVLKLYNSGMTRKNIAKQLGCSESLVGIKLKAAGIEGKPRVTHLTEEKLRELYCDKKLTQMEIATKLGTTQATVRRRLEKMGLLEDRTKRVRTVDKDQIIEAFNKGLTVTEISEQSGKSYSTVQKVLAKEGLIEVTKQDNIIKYTDVIIYLYTVEKMTLAEIAEYVKHSSIQVKKVLEQNGIKVKARGRDDIDTKEIERLMAKGMPISAVADELGCKTSLIINRLKKDRK